MALMDRLFPIERTQNFRRRHDNSLMVSSLALKRMVPRLLVEHIEISSQSLMGNGTQINLSGRIIFASLVGGHQQAPEGSFRMQLNGEAVYIFEMHRRGIEDQLARGATFDQIV